MTSVSPIKADDWRRLEDQAVRNLEELCRQGAEFTVDVQYRINVFTGEQTPLTDRPRVYRFTLPEPKPVALLPEDV